MARFQGKHFDRKIDQKKGAALRALSKIGVTSALTAVMVAEAVTPSFAASLQQVSNGAATAFPSVHAAVPVVEHSFSQEPSKLIASAVQGEQLSAEDAKAALDEAQRQSDAAKAQAEEAQKAEAEAKAAQAAAQRRADEAARAQAAEKQAAIDRVIADTEAKIAAAEKAQAEADAADKAQQAAKAAKDEADQKVAAAQKAADDAAKKLADAQASYDKLDQAEVAQAKKAYEEAQSALQQAKDSQAAADAAYSSASDALAAANADLAAKKTAAESAQAAADKAQAVEKAAEEDVAKAEDALKKAQESPEGGVVDQEAVAAAQAKVDAAATTLKTAQADTVSKRAQAEKDAAAVKDAQQAVANAQAAVDAAAADVASAKTAYDQKAEAQAKAQKAYDDAVVANKDWAAEQQRLEKSLADAKAEDAAAQQALKDAQADAAVKSSAYETAKKAYDDAVKNAGDSAKYAQGSFAFFAERGSSDALAILNGTGRYASDVINLKSGVDDGISTGTGDNYEQYRGDKVSSFTHQGDEKDATSLENMKLALDMIKRGNELRAREGLPALKVSDSMMALGQRNANVSAFARNHMQYWSTGENYKVLENLAWGNYGGLTNSDGPYDGWYWQEKANYENKDQTDGFGHTYKPQGTGSVTGHYTAMTDKMTSLGEFKTNQIAGFGVSQYDAVYRTTYSYQFVNADFLAYEKDMSDKYFGGTFQPIDVSDAVDFDTYYSQFMAYYNRVKGVANDSSTLDKLKAQLEAAKKEKEAADQTVSGAQATAGATAAKVSAAQKAADDHANSGSADVVAAKATLDAANQAAASAKVAYDGAAAKKAAADSKLSQGQKALKDAEASAKESASALDVAKSAETAADAALAKATTELEIAKKPSLKPLVDAVEKAKLAQAKATDENATAQAALLVAETELVAARDAQGKAVASEADAKQVKDQADAVVATALGVHDVAQKAYLPSKQVIDTFEAATEADSGAQTGLSVARENKAGADAALTSATVAAQKAKDVASAAAKVAESYQALDPEAAFSNGLYAGAGVDQELVAFVEAKRSAYQKAQADVDSAAADLEEAKAAYGEASAAYQRAAADAKVKEEQLDRVKAAYVATVTPEAAGSGSDIKRNAVAKVALPQTGDDAAAGVVAVAVVGASLITVGGAVALERRRKQN